MYVFMQIILHRIKMFNKKKKKKVINVKLVCKFVLKIKSE